MLRITARPLDDGAVRLLVGSHLQVEDQAGRLAVHRPGQREAALTHLRAPRQHVQPPVLQPVDGLVNACDSRRKPLQRRLQAPKRLPPLRKGRHPGRDHLPHGLRLARARYENGLTAFTDVLTAQQDLYGSEQQLAQSEAAQAQALVAVYKSLGVSPVPTSVPDDE